MVVASVSMAGRDLTARRRVAVVAASVSMAGGEIAARVVAASVSMTGGEIAARRVAASKCRPCFLPKTMLVLSRRNPTVSSLLRPLLLLQRVR